MPKMPSEITHAGTNGAGCSALQRHLFLSLPGICRHRGQAPLRGGVAPRTLSYFPSRWPTWRRFEPSSSHRAILDHSSFVLNELLVKPATTIMPAPDRPVHKSAGNRSLLGLGPSKDARRSPRLASILGSEDLHGFPQSFRTLSVRCAANIDGLMLCSPRSNKAAERSMIARRRRTLDPGVGQCPGL
jgi:hypothetical protein